MAKWEVCVSGRFLLTFLKDEGSFFVLFLFLFFV